MAMAELDMVVLGDVNPDLVLSGDVVPAFGQAEKLVDGARLVIGGSGAISACAGARLGLRTAIVGVVGDDVFGRFMRDALAERGVDVRALAVDPHRPTGITVVLSRRDDRAILTSVGTIADLRGELVDPDLLASAAHVHVSSYFLQRGLRADIAGLFDAAHEAGATTSIDPNWDPEERWDGGILGLLSRTDLFFPNSNEARAIAGLDDADVAADTLAEHGGIVAMKFGHGGGLAIHGDHVVRSDAIAIDVVDTTGAGDTFDAGFIAGHLRGWSLERCLAIAVACGSLSAREVGGTAAQPTMQEALAALEAVT